MKRLTFLLFLTFAIAAGAMAQSRKISGNIIDKEMNEPLMQTTIQLLKSDSTYVAGATSDENGVFSLSAPSNGKYILKMTNIGYKTLCRNITIANNKDMPLGKIIMETDAVLLKEVVAQGMAAKVIQKEDTFVYNASAYRVPEGSVVEELVKRLPGAQVTEDGKITINGKEVKKIMVDGKEFMTGDTQTAMKNLPSSIIDKVKAYDQRSDLSRITGIDDGDESTVLDFGIKRGMNKGFLSNTDLGYGTHNRYSARTMGGYMNSGRAIMGFLNANNTGDQGFPGGGGGGRFGGQNNGLNASKTGALNFNYENSKLIANGSVFWRHSDTDAFSRGSSESFVSQVGSFSNNESQRFSRSNSWNMQARLEWKPDTMTNILFRPSYNYSSNDGLNGSLSATFSQDPYQFTTNPLANVNEPLKDNNDNPIIDEDGNTISVNSRNNQSLSYSSNKNGNAMLQVNRKIDNNGRNVTLRVDAGFSEGESNSLTASQQKFFRNYGQIDIDPNINRFSTTPTKSWNYNLQATYSEPIAKATFLQFRYQFRHSYSKSDRKTYDYSNNDPDNPFLSQPFIFRDWNTPLYANVADPFSNPDTNLSKFSEYATDTHIAEVLLRMIRQNYNFSAGVQVQPQHTNFKQDYQGYAIDTVRNTLSITPTIDFRYRFSKVSQLRVNYRATTNQPSMTQLLKVVDNSDPLNITTGNPGLKPEIRNNMRVYYNGYRQWHMQSWMANLDFNTTQNSISNKVSYNEQTGGRTTRPENINGNWGVGGRFMFNTSIDSTGVWNVNTFTNVNYNNHVGYISYGGIDANSQKNTTKDLTLSERLSLSYRSSWLEIEPNADVSYSHARNELQKQSNLDTWRFNYGLNVNITCPWGTSISTDWHMNSRRGYNDESMNTNEFVWNAQIAQSFLMGKALTVSLQFYDILHNQSTFSRTISAMQRSDTWYNSINSYAMLHVVFRFFAFGGKNAKQSMKDGLPQGIPGQGVPGERPNRRQGGQGGPGNMTRGGFGGGYGGGMGGYGGGRF